MAYLDPGSGSFFLQVILCAQWLLPIINPFTLIGKIQKWTGVRQKWLAYIIGLIGVSVAGFILLVLFGVLISLITTGKP